MMIHRRSNRAQCPLVQLSIDPSTRTISTHYSFEDSAVHHGRFPCGGIAELVLEEWVLFLRVTGGTSSVTIRSQVLSSLIGIWVLGLKIVVAGYAFTRSGLSFAPEPLNTVAKKVYFRFLCDAPIVKGSTIEDLTFHDLIRVSKIKSIYRVPLHTLCP